MTDDKLEITPELVRALVERQFPQWASLPIRPVDVQGWDNRSFRLGETVKIRMPSAAGYVPQVGKEYRWLPYLADRLPLSIPRPLALGAADPDYPWPWSIQSWIEGEPTTRSAISDPVDFAGELAGFLVSLRQIAVDGAPMAGPDSFYRGGDLAIYDQETRQCIDQLSDRLDIPTVLAIWDAARATTWQGPPVWVHGDIAAGNLLLREGRLNAVIDFGCCAVGDPACDLTIAWTLLRGDDRLAFRARTQLDAATWARARGWALWKALLTLTKRSAAATEQAAAAEVIAALLAEHQSLSR